MFASLKMKTRLRIGFGSLLLLLVMVGCFALFEMNRLADLNRSLYEHPFTVSNTVLRIDGNIVRIHRAMKDIALAKSFNEIEDFASRVNELERLVLADFRIIEERFLGSPETYMRAEHLFIDWQPIRDEVIALMLEGRRDEASDITKGRGAIHVLKIISAMRDLSDYASNKAATFYEHTGIVLNRAVVLTAWLLVIALVFGIGFMAYFIHSIITPVAEIAGVASSISEGDLSKRITYSSDDEIGLMAQSLQRMMGGVIGEGQSIKTSIPTYFWTATRDLEINFASNEAAELHQARQEGLKGRHVDDLLGVQDNELAAMARQCLIENTQVDREVEFLTVQVPRYLEVVLSPMYDWDGKVVGIICMGLDVTLRKQAEQEANRAKEVAVAANKVKSEFLAMMSHELRTPLNGILGMLQLMSLGAMDEEQREYLNAAMSSGTGLMGIISDILDISKIESESIILVPQEFSISGVFEQVAAATREAALAKGLDYDLDMGNARDMLFKADSGRIAQVVLNLMNNSLKYTDEGEIRLNCDVIHHPVTGEPSLLFTVSDTGIGMDGDDLERLFDPFQQVEMSITRRHGGVGLGLHIVRKLVLLMNGSLHMESVPGEGTTVYVNIPVMVMSHDTPSGDASDMDDADGVEGWRVLVVEDDPASQVIAKDLLRARGYDVSVAGNGEEALHVLRKRSHDLVFMDVKMPVMDGLEATRRIRKGEASPTSTQVPIVAMTAYAFKDDRESFLAEGMTDYLSKPILAEQLYSAVDRVMK